MTQFKIGDVVRRKQNEPHSNTWVGYCAKNKTLIDGLYSIFAIGHGPFITWLIFNEGDSYADRWNSESFELVSRRPAHPAPIDFGDNLPTLENEPPVQLGVDEYVELAMRTASQEYLSEFRHHTMGLMIEAAEYGDLMHKQHNHGKEILHEDIVSELGDVAWMLACACHYHRVKLSDVLVENLEKLRKRHGNKYNANHYKKVGG